jgi:Amt family ammonium transporter
MIFTWIRYGKPDVSMCLNASLAGLVGITAPCDVTDAFGSIVIGAVSGLLVVFGVWFCDNKIHVDDPVGAVAVHMMNGIWGTIAVGLFATSSAPGYAIALEGGSIKGEGLFYGGGFTQLGLQLLGFVSVAAWAAVCMVIVFTVIKATIGLRASKEEEIRGLDIMEHGLSSAYAGFEFGGMDFVDGDVDVIGSESMEASVPALVKTSDAGDGKKITKVEILMKQERFERFKKAMNDIGVTGMTVTQVLGCGTQKGAPEYYRGVPMDIQLLPKTQVEMVISSVPVMDVINATRKALYTGHIGDGKIFVYDVEDVVKVRTGESGYDALQGEDD